jgi:hypothetical protein
MVIVGIVLTLTDGLSFAISTKCIFMGKALSQLVTIVKKRRYLMSNLCKYWSVCVKPCKNDCKDYEQEDYLFEALDIKDKVENGIEENDI